MNSQVNHIVITADLIRSISDKASKKHTANNINSIFSAIEWQLNASTGLEVKKLSYDTFNPDEFCRLLNLQVGNEHQWHRSYFLRSDEIPTDAVDYFNNRFAESLPICFEASQLMKNIFNQLGISYIDITTHPIRYLDDNLLGFRTNHPGVFAQLEDYHYDENLFYVQAGILKAQLARSSGFKANPNSALIAGQTDQDISLLKPDGTLVRLEEFEEQIAKLCKSYDTVYFKPHPYMSEGATESLSKFIKSFENVSITSENFYTLMSSENIKAVYALSSGVLNEAPYWGKQAEAFYKRYIDTYNRSSPFNETEFFAIYDDYLNPKFWADILSPIAQVNPTCPDLKISPKSNRSRIALNAFWGYDEVNDEYVKRRSSKSRRKKKKNFFERLFSGK